MICPRLILSGMGVHVRFTLNDEVGIAWKCVTLGGTVKKKKKNQSNVTTTVMPNSEIMCQCFMHI